MSKNNGGLFSFVVGIAAGAGAVFFSKKANRDKAEKVIKKVALKAKKAEAEYKKDPEAFKKKTRAQVKKVARQASVMAKKKINKATRTTKG